MVATDGFGSLLPPITPVDVWALAKYRPGEGPLGSLALKALPQLLPVQPVSVSALLPVAAPNIVSKGKQGNAAQPSQAGKATAATRGITSNGSARAAAAPAVATSVASDVTAAAKDARNKATATAVLPEPPPRTIASGSLSSPSTSAVDGAAEDALGAAIGALASETRSAYRHIFLTSPPGVGKTTMVQKLISKLKAEDGDGVRVTGFFTEEIRMDNGQRCGFDIVRVGDGSRRDLQQRCILARIGQDPPKVGKYSIDVVGFEHFALPMLAKKTLDKLPENPRLYTAIDGTVQAVGLLEDREGEESSSDDNSSEENDKKQEKDADAMEDAVAVGGKGSEVAAEEGGAIEKMEDGDVPADQVTGENGEDGEKNNKDKAARMCRILLPLTEQELLVEESKLQPVPEGWKAPRDPDDSDSDEDHPRPRLCVCDEVGKMELLSLRFPDAFLSTLDSGVSVLGTIPQPARGQIDSEVVETVKKRSDVRVMRITRNNRDSLTEQAYAFLRESLGLGPPGTGRVRRSKRKLEREAAERKEREKAEAKEREKAAKRERQAAKERERAQQAQKLARKRKIQGQRAREKRKALALVKQRSQELAKSGILGVEDEADSDSLELQDDQLDTLASVEDSDSAPDVDEVDKVEDLETVEDVDAVLDVEDKQSVSGPRKAPRLAAPKAAKPQPPVSGQMIRPVHPAKAKAMVRPALVTAPKAKVPAKVVPLAKGKSIDLDVCLDLDD